MCAKTQIEIAIELTEFCNLKCDYCCQDYEHKDSSTLPLNTFKLFITKFITEINKYQERTKPVHLDISLLGGELSVLWKQNNYFEYFNFLKTLLKRNNISAKFILLTNFTGDFEFFQEFLRLKDENLDIEIHATFHQTYFNSYKKIENAFNKIKKLEIPENFNFIICFLVNESTEFKNMYTIFNDLYNVLDIKELDFIKLQEDKLLKIGKNESGEYGYNFVKSSSEIKYCNVLQYEFDFKNLIIKEHCRGKRTNILKWSVDDSFVECKINCIYPSLWENFTQLSESEYFKRTNNVK